MLYFNCERQIEARKVYLNETQALQLTDDPHLPLNSRLGFSGDDSREVYIIKLVALDVFWLLHELRHFFLCYNIQYIND